MNVSFLLPGRNFSGGIRCGTRMASELLHRGHDVQILYRRNAANIKNIARNLYSKLIVMPPKDWISQFQGECASFRKLTAELVGKRDVLVAIGPDCVEDMSALPDECGCKVFYAHGLTLRNPQLRKIAWSKNIPVIAVSNYVHQAILVSGNKTMCGVVPNGVDTSEYFPDECENKKGAVGTTFGPGVAKDPATILSVFTMLREKRPELPLVCFGSCNRPRDLDKSIHYEHLPTVSRARRLYSKCAVWFCASRSEGFGMPLLEAMACGCAVVSSDCGGPNDFIKTGINGVLVEKESPQRLAEEIMTITDNEALQRQIASKAQETARMLSWSSAASKIESILEDIVHGC